jgi:hypothetical protein
MKIMNNSADFFNEWFDTYGIRTFSVNHGNADGHRDYMSMAFQAGYHACLANDMGYQNLKEQNQRLKDEINCRLT